LNSAQAGKLTLEWVELTDGVALVFDKPTWEKFKPAAKVKEQSAQVMITRAVVAAFGEIMKDNMVLNQFLRR
jgi:hypothetical protein